MKLETGAPAALKRLETEELTCYEKKERLEAALAALVEPALNAAVEIRDAHKSVKAAMESDLLFAFKRWDVARKSLGEYDKGVKAERREGEKILVSEVKELFAQLMLSISLAVEQTIIADAQSSALCDSPQAFHSAHAANMRAAMAGAIDAAKKEGVLPAWVMG